MHHPPILTQLLIRKSEGGGLFAGAPVAADEMIGARALVRLESSSMSKGSLALDVSLLGPLSQPVDYLLPHLGQRVLQPEGIALSQLGSQEPAHVRWQALRDMDPFAGLGEYRLWLHNTALAEKLYCLLHGASVQAGGISLTIQVHLHQRRLTKND